MRERERERERERGLVTDLSPEAGAGCWESGWRLTGGKQKPRTLGSLRHGAIKSAAVCINAVQEINFCGSVQAGAHTHTRTHTHTHLHTLAYAHTHTCKQMCLFCRLLLQWGNLKVI